jgi:hypothetical protein
MTNLSTNFIIESPRLVIPIVIVSQEINHYTNPIGFGIMKQDR